MFAVAELLHRPVYELEHEMPASELDEWMAWMRLKRERERKAAADARRGSSNKQGKRGRR